MNKIAPSVGSNGRGTVGRAALSGSALAAWIALFAALAPSHAISKVQDCAAVSAGHAEPVWFAAPLESFSDVQVQGVFRKPVGDRRFAALVLLHGAGGIHPPRC